VDRTDSGSCPVAGFSISGVEPSGSKFVTYFHMYNIFHENHNNYSV
jgi:hypothetical protein